MSEQFVVVKGWDKFQHYKQETRPAWIKTFTRLLNDDHYIALSGHQRAVLHGLWLLYASSARRLPLDTRSLSHRIGLRVSSHTLKVLSDAGFIEFCSREALEKVYARVEKSREEKKSSNTFSELKSVATEADVVSARERREQAGWVDNLSQYTGCRYVRGEVGIQAVYDPLGTEWPPDGWPYQRPTKQEVVAAQKEAANA